MKPCACLHPIRIYNKSLHTYMNVPCGHCSACQVIKGYRRAEKVNAAFNQFHYRYFVTLTYRDECLSLAKFDNEVNRFVSDDCDYNGECYHVDLNSESVKSSKDFILQCVQKYGGIPVLSHSDLIKFKKRLRKYIYEKLGYYPSLFIYSVGEYGPLHYRPHWHLCIGFNERQLQSVFRQCVNQAWTMYSRYSSEVDLRLVGKIDIQPVVGKGCANYCATYLNCTTHLPAVLGRTVFRPFSTKSPTSDFELRRTGDDNVRDVFNRCSITQTYIDSESFKESTTLCGNLYRDTYFPKCPSFSSLSHADRVVLYGVYEKFYGVSFDLHSSRFSATHFANFIRGDLSLINYRYPYLTNTVRLLKMICCVGDEFQSITKLKRLYYVSRRVYNNSVACGVTVDDYVKRIELFYYRYEMDKLRRFYTTIQDLMSDLVNPLPLSKIFHLYYDTSEKIHNFDYYRKQFGVFDRTFCPQVLPSQIDYAIKMEKISLDNTKTKKRNDDYEHRGIVPLPYQFRPTKNKQKFINSFL